jgi:coenzyme F420 hydrogenase subunit beta
MLTIAQLEASRLDKVGYYSMTVMDFQRLQKQVIKRGLCTHCGTCVGACPNGVLTLSDPLGECLPQQIGECQACGLCYRVCPGKGLDWQLMNKRLFHSQPDPYLGCFKEIYLGHSLQPDLRSKASAGGVVTSLVSAALESGLAQRALLVGHQPDNPWAPQPFWAQTSTQAQSAAQSTYALVPVNALLGELDSMDGKAVVVALPCQVHGLRNLQKSRPKSAAKIECIIGLYCGINLYLQATLSLLARFGIKDLSQIQSLNYRAGSWPGRFEVILHNGQTHTLSKSGFNYLSPFYGVPRCWQCVDLCNEFADISIGDGWAKEDMNLGGWSVVISRTEAGVKLLASAADRLKLEKIDPELAKSMHAHSISNKKVGGLLRVHLTGGKAAPNYGLQPPRVGAARKAFERLNLLILRICATRPARWAVDRVPLKILDGFFTGLRTFWRRVSDKSKN